MRAEVGIFSPVIVVLYIFLEELLDDLSFAVCLKGMSEIVDKDVYGSKVIRFLHSGGGRHVGEGCR